MVVRQMITVRIECDGPYCRKENGDGEPNILQSLVEIGAQLAVAVPAICEAHGWGVEKKVIQNTVEISCSVCIKNRKGDGDDGEREQDEPVPTGPDGGE